MVSISRLAAVALSVALAVPATAQDLKTGLEALRSEDYTAALENFHPLAIGGNAYAQFNLGLMYGKGEGVPQDDAEAVRWYTLAAEQGVAPAQGNLGNMYREGKGVAQDAVEAVRLHTLAAEQGADHSQFNLGSMYLQGSGVAQDDVKAVRWYTLAAEQGNPFAQNALGAMYNMGKGVPQDYVLAHMWYNLASANANTDASKNRKNIETSMTREQIAEAQARARACMSSVYRDCN